MVLIEKAPDLGAMRDASDVSREVVMTGPRSSRARRWLAAWTALVLIAIAGLIPAASVAAAEPDNPVLDWNVNAVNAIGNAPTAAIPGLGQPARHLEARQSRHLDVEHDQVGVLRFDDL